MQITIDINTGALCQILRYDSRKIGIIVGALTASLNMFAEAMEEINKPAEPIAVPKKAKPQAKDPEKKPDKEPKEVKFVPIDKVAPKKKRTREAQEAIDAIKEAYEKKRGTAKPEKKTRNKRADIDNNMIVQMRDKNGMKFAKIAKEIGCCEQTVINRYNKAKNGGDK